MSGETESGGMNGKMDRRQFLGLAALVSFIGACGMVVIGLLKLPSPSVFPEVSGTFKIGKFDDFPVGSEKLIESRRVLILRDKEGLFAISTICTHLGCVVSKTETGFLCACHGSEFDEKGRVNTGPAPKALEWLEVAQLPNGVLTVDTSRTVPFGTKLSAS